jgi:site-specific recombinase XerD
MEKGKRGRKRIKFTDEQVQEACRLAGLGFSEEAICKTVLSVSTLQRYKKKNENFEQYIRDAKIKSIATVSSALFDSATGRNGKEPSVSAQIFFLKNKGKQAGNPFSDVQQVEHNLDLKSILTNAKDRLIIDGQATPTNERERIPNIKTIGAPNEE